MVMLEMRRCILIAQDVAVEPAAPTIANPLNVLLDQIVDQFAQCCHSLCVLNESTRKTKNKRSLKVKRYASVHMRGR
jgi:hypothetical protein